MQYNGYAFSANGRPTIIDRRTNQPVPYNRKVTQSDFTQLNALYQCGSTNPNPTPRPTNAPTSCRDSGQYCPAWATSGYCNGGEYAPYMKENCKKSCRFCTTSTPKLGFHFYFFQTFISFGLFLTLMFLNFLKLF